MKGAVRQFTLALCAFFFSATVGAVDCPVNQEGTIPGDWPLTKSPTGTWSVQGTASAQTKCGYSETQRYTTPTIPNQSTYAAAVVAADNAAATWSVGASAFQTSCAAMEGTQWVETRVYRKSTTPNYIFFIRVSVNTTGTACTPPVTTCEIAAGHARYVEWPISAGSPPETTCAAHCNWNRGSVGIGIGSTMTWAYRSAGTACSTTPNEDVAAAPDTDDDNEFDNCVADGGDTFCYKDDRTNCGQVNGEFVCLPDTSSECEEGAGGGKLCGATSSTPPSPDNGVPGVPATPDAVLPSNDAGAGGGGTTNNYYYNSGTVGNSTGTGGSEGGTPGCDPATDTGCTDVGKEWVDRDWKPPGLPEMPENPYGEYDAEAAWGDGTAGKDVASGFVGTLSTMFPFSLVFSGPLEMFSTSTAAPEFSYTASGHTASASMSMWNDLFELVRVASGLLMIFGVYLLVLATLSVWAGK